MKNILVTGASGFLGTQVLKHLNRNGYCIHAIGRNKSPLNDNCGVHWHSIDLLDSVETRKLLRLVRAEGLIHLAWETEHSIYWNSPNNLNWVEASLSLARDFAFYGGERIVIAGTSAEYEWGSLFDLNERKSTIAPSSLYGKSKNDLREQIEIIASDTKLSWSWGRFFNIFGPGEKSLRLIPRVIRTLIERESLRFDSGKLVRDFLHVAEAGSATCALFESNVQGAVNIASGQGISIFEVVSEISKYLNAEELVQFNAAPDPTNQPMRVVADTLRLRNEVGWLQSISTMDRMKEYCEWYAR